MMNVCSLQALERHQHSFDSQHSIQTWISFTVSSTSTAPFCPFFTHTYTVLPCTLGNTRTFPLTPILSLPSDLSRNMLPPFSLAMSSVAPSTPWPTALGATLWLSGQKDTCTPLLAHIRLCFSVGRRAWCIQFCARLLYEPWKSLILGFLLVY